MFAREKARPGLRVVTVACGSQLTFGARGDPMFVRYGVSASILRAVLDGYSPNEITAQPDRKVMTIPEMGITHFQAERAAL